MFLEVLQKTRGVVSVVCEHLNIGRSTYYHWKKTDSDFSVKVEEIIFSKPEMIEDRLYAKAMDGDVSSMKFFLKHKHPDYGGKSNTESTVHIYHHVDRPPEKSDETNDFTLMLWKEARKRWEIKNSIKTENTDENPDSDATEKTGKSV